MQARQHHQVDAGAKVPSLACQYHDPYLRRVIRPLKDPAKLVPHLLVQGIGLVRTVEMDGGDMSLQRDGQRFRCSMVSPRKIHGLFMIGASFYWFAP